MAVSARDLNVDQEFTAVVVDDLRRTQIVQYAGASGDFNPLHTDEVFSTQVAGNPGTFAHGMLTMGLTGRVITDLVGVDRIVSYGGRFTAQVWPGDTLTASATVTDIREEDGDHLVEFAIVTTNQDGVKVFTGTAIARLDP